MRRDEARLRLVLAVPDVRSERSVDLPLDGHALGWVVSERVAITASADDVFHGEEAGWIAAAPLAGRDGERLGCVALDFASEPGRDAARALELASGVASRLLLEASSAERARGALLKYEALYGAVHDLDRNLDLRELAAVACRRARRVTGARGAVITTWEARTQSGRVVATDGEVAPGLSYARLDGDASLLGLALKNSSILPRDDLTARGTLPLYVEGIHSRAGSAIIVPLLIDDDPIGAVAVEYERRRQYDETDLERLKTLALFIAPAFRNAISFGEVKALSLTDALTGLPNRRASERALASTTAICQRTGGDFSVAVVDLDLFKQVNDNHGHQAGDRVLQTVARAIRAELRPGDHAGRWGGEEFLIVLPSTRLADAAGVLERIRQQVERLRVAWNGREVRVTLSSGVSAYPEIVSDAARLVATADAALYTAKRAGRNSVALAQAGR